MLQGLWASFALQIRMSFSRRVFQYSILVQPAVFVVVSYLMFLRGQVKDYLPYVIIGSGLANLWCSVVFSSAGDIERERFMGNLEALNITPTPFEVIMLGKVLGNLALGLGSVALTVVYARVLFGASLDSGNLPVLGLSLLATVVGFVGLSMLTSTVFTLTRNAMGLINCMEIPVYILAGIFFPLAVLPGWTRPFSYVLAPTWSAIALRNSLHAAIPVRGGVSGPVAVLFLLGGLYVLAAHYLYGVVDRKTRATGELGKQ